jgi:hypothetical protein
MQALIEARVRTFSDARVARHSSMSRERAAEQPRQAATGGTLRRFLAALLSAFAAWSA